MNLCICPLAPSGNRERLDSLESNRQNTKFCAKPILQNVDYARATPSFFLLYCETVLVSSTLVVATVVQQFAQHYEFEYCPPGDCTEIFPSIFAVLCLAYTLPLLENQCCHTKDHSRPFVQTALQDHNWISWFTMPMQVDSSDDKSFGSLSHCLNIFNHVWNQS